MTLSVSFRGRLLDVRWKAHPITGNEGDDRAVREYKIDMRKRGLAAKAYFRGEKHALRMIIAATALGALLALPACGSPESRAAKAMARYDEYFAQHDLLKARVEIRSAIHAQSEIPEYWNKLGRVELDLNNPQNAYSAYARVLEIDPQNREALQAVAELSYSGASPDAALKYADQMLRLEPRTLRMLLVKGLIAFDRTEYDDARALSAQMQGIDPGNEGAAILLSRVQYATGDPKGAIATVENSISQHGIGVQKLMMLIDFYNDQNDFPKLNHSYARMFRLDPDNIRLRLDYARILYENGLPDRALIVIDRLQHRYPRDQKLQREIVDLWLAIGSDKIDLDQVRRIAGAGNEQMKLAVAELAVDQKRYEEARQILAPFVVADKIIAANVQAKALYAIALSGLGKKAEAAALVSQILAFDKSNPQALLLRLQLAVDRHDLIAALNDAQVLTSDNPRLAPGWIAFAQVYTLRHERVLADGIYGRAMENLPDSVEILKAYTTYMMGTGRPDLALDIADRFTRANRKSLDGWKIRGDLCLVQRDDSCVQQVRDNVAPLRGGDKLRNALKDAVGAHQKSRPPVSVALHG
jgi:cytochrome c-type biogenesis protein CcmH/NrfG